jgi:hypothetical protein
MTAKKYKNGKLINLSASSKYLGMPVYKPKARPIQIKVIPSPKKPEYTIPKTPKVSGLGWGP